MVVLKDVMSYLPQLFYHNFVQLSHLGWAFRKQLVKQQSSPQFKFDQFRADKH